MSRDPKKLRTFHLADGLVIDIYRETRPFPVEERYGLQAQIRRAAVSSATNLVEGSARRSTREYLHFINIAVGSALEARYLIDLAARLGFMPVATSHSLTEKYTELAKGLLRLLSSLDDRP